jgi:hypothetical protein
VISPTQAQQYLDQLLGVGSPAFLISSAVEEVEAYESAMAAAGYSEGVQVRIQCMAVALLVAAGDPRRLTSQSAPSGAARGFKYSDKDLSALRKSLAALDTAGVVSALVGPDPNSPTLLMIV